MAPLIVVSTGTFQIRKSIKIFNIAHVQSQLYHFSFGSGSWVISGVITNSQSSKGNYTSVQCTSTHLTSFAVLVDVAGGLQV